MNEWTSERANASALPGMGQSAGRAYRVCGPGEQEGVGGIKSLRRCGSRTALVSRAQNFRARRPLNSNREIKEINQRAGRGRAGGGAVRISGSLARPPLMASAGDFFLAAEIFGRSRKREARIRESIQSRVLSSAAQATIYFPGGGGPRNVRRLSIRDRWATDANFFGKFRNLFFVPAHSTLWVSCDRDQLSRSQSHCASCQEHSVASAIRCIRIHSKNRREIQGGGGSRWLT